MRRPLLGLLQPLQVDADASGGPAGGDTPGTYTTANGASVTLSDTNGDGKIDKVVVTKSTDGDAAPEAVMTLVDTDGDGALDSFTNVRQL